MEALVLSLESPPDILCLTETWLTDNDNFESHLVTGYNQYIVKNQTTSHGGVMIQIRSTCSLVKQNDHSFDEAIFADISAKGYTFKLVVIYNKPRSNKMEFLNTLEDFLENTSIANQPTVICGDINIDILANNLLTRNYTELIQSFGCSLYPDEPTRLTNISNMP